MSIKFPKYKLSEKQIRGLANIVQDEQGTAVGMYAEASLMANLTDIAGDSNATVSKLIAKATGGWFAYGGKRYRAGYEGTINFISPIAIDAVKNCIVKGKRILPRYVNEHDCISDLKYIKNNGYTKNRKDRGNYISHKTVCHNRYGSTWIFYAFPGGAVTGVDPFGYTSKKYRSKWGDFCYTPAQSQNDKFVGEPTSYTGILPVLPDESFGVDRDYYQKGDGIDTLKDYPTQIERVQESSNWATDSNEETDGKYGGDTEKLVSKLQKQAGLPVNGKFGKRCLEYIKNLKK